MKITFIADLHHYSEALGTSGRAYELRSGSDQKCLAETGAIIDSAFTKIGDSDTESVVILGDITNNGEIVSHEEIREKLYNLKKKKPVYVITATHDWCCDKNPRRFEGTSTFHDVPVMKAENLRDFYKDFGPSEAVSEFFTHLGTSTYTVDIGDKVRLFCFNDDQNGKGKSGYKEDHLQWIEKEIKKARKDGKIVLGASHHLVMSHIHPMLARGGTCIGDKEKVASRFADAGLHYTFAGHSHIQHINSFTSEKGNTIYEVNVGSLVGYPSPIINVEITDDKIHIETQHPDEFTYKGISYDTLSYTRKHSLMLVDNLFSAAQKGKDEFCDRLTALGIPQDKASILYIIAHPMLKYVSNCTVGEGYKKLKLFGMGRLFEKSLIEEFKHKNVMDFAYEIFLSALDGSTVRHPKGSSYYRIVMSFMAIPLKIKDIDLTRGLYGVVESILTGSKWDINNCDLPNLYN
ncbi:MAG: metallophosphoesterase [Clostridia bacterium]|nr:metallophosphoesterase [Clostridia bacterium]